MASKSEASVFLFTVFSVRQIQKSRGHGKSQVGSHLLTILCVQRRMKSIGVKELLFLRDITVSSVNTRWDAAQCVPRSTQQNTILNNAPAIPYSQLLPLLHMFNRLFSRTTWVSRHQKGKPFWILLEQEMMGGSGISWTICKSFATCSRQITTPVPHHSVFFYRPDAHPATQPTVSKHWRPMLSHSLLTMTSKICLVWSCAQHNSVIHVTEVAGIFTHTSFIIIDM